MEWPISENLKSLGFTMISHGNLPIDQMSISMPGLTMEEEAEEGMAMEAMAKDQVIHLVVYHRTCPYKAANYCLTLLDHPCKLLTYQIQDITSLKRKVYNFLQSLLGFLGN